jgi:hypothetical protein
VELRTWVQSLSLADWRKSFRASPAELRSLLEYVRDQRGGVAVDLITNNAAIVEVDLQLADMQSTPVTLARTDTLPMAPVGLWVADDLVATIRSRDQADIQSLLRTGLAISTHLVVLAGKATLELRLEEFDV